MNHPQPTEKNYQPSYFEGAPPWNYPPQYSQAEEDANLLDYWRVAVKRKWQILIVFLLCVGLSVLVTYVCPKKYRAEASIMPITSSGSGGMSGLMNQIGSMPLLGGALGDLGKLGGGKSKELVNILKSRTIAEKIINRFDLLKVIFAKQYDPQTKTFHEGFPAFLKPIPVLEDGVEKFSKKIAKVDEDKKTGLIKVQISMKDPVLAAKVTNQMIVELQDFIENNSLTVAKRNRIFLEEQLVKTRAKLLEAGKHLNQFYADNKISSVVPQVDVEVGSYQRAPKAFAEFEDEFTDLSNLQAAAEQKVEQAKVNNVPGQVYLQYLTLNRELLGKTYALLTQQYELAKIDEAKEDLAFQVIDKAEIKVRQYFPKIKEDLVAGVFGGIVIAFFFAFFCDYIEKLKLKSKPHH
ncbi:MAG: Wzz/FepE/Etk N-terminal domain-containing protein [bacterium]